MCVRENHIPLMIPAANGDLGVDIFFVLSGFLIGYILLKEASSHEGDLDWFSFMRNRFIRIWPAMFVFSLATAPIFAGIFGPYAAWFKYFLSNITFMNNLWGMFSHVWSVAVEF